MKLTDKIAIRKIIEDLERHIVQNDKDYAEACQKSANGFLIYDGIGPKAVAAEQRRMIKILRKLL